MQFYQKPATSASIDVRILVYCSEMAVKLRLFGLGDSSVGGFELILDKGGVGTNILYPQGPTKETGFFAFEKGPLLRRPPPPLDLCAQRE